MKKLDEIIIEKFRSDIENTQNERYETIEHYKKTLCDNPSTSASTRQFDEKIRSIDTKIKTIEACVGTVVEYAKILKSMNSKSK